MPHGRDDGAPPATAPGAGPGGPLRLIGAVESFSIVAGSMLGIGIFLVPSIVATNLPNPLMFLAMWAAGGLVSLAGAVACGELGAMMPRAGGDYEFQYEAFGPSVAFASGWTLFAAIFCGSIAAMSVALCNYQLPVVLGFDLSASIVELPWGVPLTRAGVAALVLVPLLTLLNARGVRPSARAQTAMTLVPVLLFAVMALWLMLRGAPPAAVAPAEAPGGGVTLGGLAASYMAVYFAYSGWINIIYVAGEVAEPGKNIPRALLVGTVAVTLLYLLLCGGFLQALGIAGLQQAGEAGTASATSVAGEGGKLVFTVLLASALVASINATILGGARVAYAMGRRGAMFHSLGQVAEDSHVPTRALWFQALVSCALILSGRFEDILQMVSLAMVATGALTVASVFVLRRTRPEMERPYRATGYPLLPLLYVLSSVVVIAIMVHEAWAGVPRAGYRLFGVACMVALFLGHYATRERAAG